MNHYPKYYVLKSLIFYLIGVLVGVICVYVLEYWFM